ncbi:hypothetical protein [Terracoccus sp. 273MFTsu3.1]|uniref:hypothetical protein n=1 Tax=Terracoccus sp. 273MFTsu3.1 TaxID=1172188 RepID=UPI000369ED74|nr:hypothetical protein [Terracoccus sp. 273MFTsu3.1]
MVALLVAGAALVSAVIVWPTQRLVSQGPGGAEPIVDIWLWGRAQVVERLGSTASIGATGASAWTLVALVAAGVLALVAAVLWLAAARRRDASGPRRGVAAAVAVLAAAGVAASTGLTGVVEFGWFAYGSPTGEPAGDTGQILVDSTVVAAFVPVAIGLWIVALVVVVVTTFRGRLAPGAAGVVKPA